MTAALHASPAMAGAYARRSARAARRALVASLAAHGSILAVLVGASLAGLAAWRPPRPAPAVRVPVDMELVALPAAGTAAEAAARDWETWDEPPPASITREEAMALLRRRIEQNASLSEAEKRERLERLPELARLVREESVDEIARMMGLDPESHRPAESPPGPFDHRTARFEDIRRIRDAERGAGYRMVMVDAEGRTWSFDVFGADATLYDDLHRVFRLAQQNPAFGTLWRRLALPLLQQMAEERQRGGRVPGSAGTRGPPKPPAGDHERKDSP